MKSYGVNWFLVWLGLLVFTGPFYAWLAELLYFFDSPTFHTKPFLFSQAFGQACCFTCLYYYSYSKTLDDPEKVEKLRQSREKRNTSRKSPFRWVIAWGVIFTVVACISVICHLVFHQLSWPHLVVYSLVLPCTSLVSLWLQDKAAKKGRLEQLLKSEGTMR